MTVDLHRTVGRRRRLLAAPAVALSLVVLACGAPEPPAGGSRPADASGAGQSVPEGNTAPTRVEIPTIDVAAAVVELGLNPDRTLEVPRDYGDAGWWSGGASPGEPGPAVVVGHVDSSEGPAVFFRLPELEPGDEVLLTRGDGSVVRFVVERLERHPKDDFPTESVYGETPEPTLRLITCSGDFDAATRHYTDNTIVFATRS